MSRSYQGANEGSGKAYGEESALAAIPDIEVSISKHPRIAGGDHEALRQLRSLRTYDDIVTIYRAAPADHINTNDWVFLSESRADRFAHKTFEPTKMREGYKVLKAQVRASEVMWTGKNLEFTCVGKRRKGI